MGDATSLLIPTFGARASRNRQDFPRTVYTGNYGGPSYSNGGKSIGFVSADAADLIRTSNATFGVANNYTIMAWVKGNSLGDARTAMNLLSCGNVAQLTDGFELSVRPTASQFRAFLQGSSGGNTTFKDYRFGAYVKDVWTLVGWTWDGTTLLCYQDGALDSDPLKVLDNAGTTTDASRRGGVGVDGKGTDSTILDGNLHLCALWDTALDAANLLAMYNGGDGNGFDLREDLGNYTGSANLVQLWLLGTRLAPNLGNTAVGGPGSYHFNIETVIDDTYIQDDAPTG